MLLWTFLNLAQGAELQVGPGQPYASISAALMDAGDNDIITVHEGTYMEPQLNITQQNLLLCAEPGAASRPVIVSKSGQYGNMIIINADGITIRGLEITHQSGHQHGYGIGDADGNAARSGWTVENCVIHSCRSAVYNNKMSNFTFRNNEVYNNHSEKLKLDATESFVCIGNVFRDATRHEEKDPSTVILWKTGNDDNATGDTMIMYNYMHGGYDIVYLVAESYETPSGNRTITIAHNTMDGKYGAWNVTNDYASALIHFGAHADGNDFDSAKITIRDNIFVEAHWYAIGFSGLNFGLIGDLEVQNCLFFNNYSHDPWYPLYKSDNEWPGARGHVGWLERGDNFVFSNYIIADPLLARGTNSTAETYYALQSGSPALGAASNGSNIGAWQPSDPGPFSANMTWHGPGSITTEDPQRLWYGNATFLIQSDNEEHHISGISVDGSVIYTNTANRGISSTNFVVFVSNNIDIHATFSPTFTDAGIPLTWLADYGITNYSDNVESMDLDGDGFTVLQEYIADTNPQDDTSFFPPVTMTITNNYFTFGIDPTSSNRHYYIVGKTNLMDSVWTVITNAPGTGGPWFVEIPITNNIPSFFRSKVTLP